MNTDNYLEPNFDVVDEIAEVVEVELDEEKVAIQYRDGLKQGPRDRRHNTVRSHKQRDNNKSITKKRSRKAVKEKLLPPSKKKLSRKEPILEEFQES